MTTCHGEAVVLPPDNHVHTQWSWDATKGSMERSCARAVEVGLPAVAFTEHLDHTVWTVAPGEVTDPDLTRLVDGDGRMTAPAFDAVGYLAEVERCRGLFPDLRILSGLEIGEPHWHAEAVSRVLHEGRFDRLLGSLHCLPDGDGFVEPPGLLRDRSADRLLRDYLAEIALLVAGSDVFTVLAHIDYPVRFWPVEAGPFDPAPYEDELRHALRATAESGKALEVNTSLPLHATILGWWREEGGRTVSFGSDAHEPSEVARGFRDASRMADVFGFRPGRTPYDLWTA